MKRTEVFDLTYVTIDSLSEGVGSSQIIPLVARLANTGLRINLISYEKVNPRIDLVDFFHTINVEWNFRSFGSSGAIGGMKRLSDLKHEIPKTKLIHARSDIPAVSAVYSHQAPVLWDVRSLWADQKIMIQNNTANRFLYKAYRHLEGISASKSIAMSTLTHAVVPILQERNTQLPNLRTVVPTAVDLDRFKLNPKVPSKIRALFSGTYNEYYDLILSAKFMNELGRIVPIETHWARPLESKKSQINVGETLVFPSSQVGMSQLIPHYSFGMSVCKSNAGTSLTAAMPTKIGEFLACGRPIVVNRGLGDMDAFINEFNAGVILDEQVESLRESANRLVNILLDPETPFRCRALAEKYFSMDIGVSRYLDIYSQMS